MTDARLATPRRFESPEASIRRRNESLFDIVAEDGLVDSSADPKG